MRKLILALVLTTALCLALAAVAAADPGNIQVSGQSATTSQQAGAASSATQIDPSNTNVSIRVLSPGDDGSVSQSNTAASSASAGNQAATTQTANQTGAGSGIQTAEQQAGTDQVALALSEAAQLGASNVNTPVRVLSPGDDGSVTQGNSVGSQATSGNTAATGQTSTQGQSSACSCSGSGSGIQSANQSAGTGQESGAASTATQDHPSNTNVSIRVLSPGGDGSVSQANTVGSQATSGNAATTGQTATQNQGSPSCGCSGSGSGIQSANQSADTEQESGALSTATQDHPSNTNVSIRVLSPGDDGSVSQANTAGSIATSGNSATTTQNATQTQGGSGSGCGCGTVPVRQAPAGTQAPVTSDAPTGAANQSNAAGSSANAGNLGSTGQNASQNASGKGIQIGDQSAGTDQSSVALSSAKQIDPSNTAGSTRVLSPGDDGSVSQANTVGSAATSGNSATTTQSSTQSQGGSCGCHEPIRSDVPSSSCPSGSSTSTVLPVRLAGDPGRGPAGGDEPGLVRRFSRRAGRCVERRLAGSRLEPGRRRERHAVEHRRFHRHVRQCRDDDAVGRSVGRGPRLWLRRQCDPGRRPEGGHRPGVARALGRRADLRARQVRLWVRRQLVGQHRLAGSRLEPRLRRERDAVEHRRLVGDLRQQRHDGSGRNAETPPVPRSRCSARKRRRDRDPSQDPSPRSSGRRITPPRCASRAPAAAAR